MVYQINLDMRQEHHAVKKMCVSYCGQTVSVNHFFTNERRVAKITVILRFYAQIYATNLLITAQLGL